MSNIGKSVGVLGGAFDPVHLGHISLAEDAYQELGFDEIWFVPAAQSPLKNYDIVLDAASRVALLEAALATYPYFKIIGAEIERGGVSYTIDSVRRFKTEFPDTDFYWVIGGDQFAQLDKWKDIEGLCGLLQFVVVSRPGYEVDTAQIPDISGLRFSELRSRMLDIASSEIRERLASGDAAYDLLSKAVSDLILARNYYSV